MIEILLATHNGEKFLSTQLDSLLNQTYKDFCITIFDDNSSDNTNEIIDKYITNFPQKISRLNSNICFKSACKSFNHLINNSKSDYVALCDQDDIWKKDKLYYEMKKMLELEKINGSDTPILVHCDLSVTDENLSITHSSFFKYKNLSKTNKISNLLVENNVTGCTCLMNNALIQITKAIPSSVKIHDWWIALCASCFGDIGFVNKRLVLYRQHQGNVIGAHNKIKGKNKIKNSISYSYYQSKKFLLKYSEEMPITMFKKIAEYSCFPYSNKFYKLKKILFYGYKKHSIIKTIGQLWYC